MKILYFMNSCHNFLGAARSVALLASNLPPHIEPLAVFPDRGRAVDGFQSRGIRSLVVQAPDVLNLTDKKLIHTSRLRQAAIFARHIIPYTWRLMRLIRREKPDIIHCQAGRALLIVGWAARLCGKPVIWHVRGENILQRQPVLDYAAHRLATTVVVVADALKEGIRPGIPCRTIYNAIDFDSSAVPPPLSSTIDGLLAGQGFDPRQTVKVISTSAFLPHKGLHHLLDALYELFRRRPELSRSVAWLILGEANSEEKRRYEHHLRTRAAELGIEKNLIWAGWQDQGASWIAASDVTVLPTVKDERFRYADGRQLRLVSTEGLPRTVLEALAAGRPAIASDVGGVRELLRDGETGFVVKPSDPLALADALEALVTDGNRRAVMGANARRYAEQFTVKRCVDETVQLYEELTSSTDASGRIRVVTAVTIPLSCILIEGQLAYMRKAGFDVCLVTSDGEDARAFAKREGVRFRPLSMAREISPLNDLRSLLASIRLLRRERPHIVNAGTPKAGLLLMLASWLCRVPARIYTLRGIRYESEHGLRRRILIATERLACRAATQVVCISPSVRDLAVADRLCRPSKTVIIGGGSSNGVDLSRFSRAKIGAGRIAELRRTHAIEEGDYVIGFVGRLIPRKGVPELVEAWSVLRERIPSSRLLLVGPLESEQPLPAGVLETVSSDPRVIRTGFVTNVEEYMCLMNVFVFPAHWEGFGNVLAQASACEVPIVATRVTGVRDSVNDGVSGVLVEKGDVPGVVAAVLRYHDHPELAKEHGRRGSEWVRAQFASEPIWEGLAGLYRQHTTMISAIPRRSRA